MTYVIAEAGTGHYHRDPGTRLLLAERFIWSAAQAGANAVKFQMFVPDEALFCPLPGDDDRMERWNWTCLPLEPWAYLKDFAESCGIDLLWSVFQPTAVEWLKELKPRYVKVASRAAVTFPYSYIKIAPFIISHGMDDSLPEIDHPCAHLSCISKYPTPISEAGRLSKRDGLSDHSGTIWPGLHVMAHGAPFLEVHFKIGSANMGNDEPVCLTEEQLKFLCEARDAFAAMHQN